MRQDNYTNARIGSSEQALILPTPPRPKHWASDRSSYHSERFGTGIGKAKKLCRSVNQQAARNRDFKYSFGLFR